MIHLRNYVINFYCALTMCQTLFRGYDQHKIPAFNLRKLNR